MSPSELYRILFVIVTGNGEGEDFQHDASQVADEEDRVCSRCCHTHHSTFLPLTMTVGRASTAFGGFLLGALATLVASYYLNSKANEDDDEGSEQTPRGVTSFLRGTPPKNKPRSGVAVASSLERVGFLSDIVAQLWSHINIAGSQMIKETVEPMFKEMLPGPLASLHFTKIDLGNSPIRLDNIVVNDIKDGALQFNLDFNWITDCAINMKADYVGAFGVKSIKLTGRMTFLLKPLTNELPIVSAIQYGFINPPNLELDYSGLASIADFTIVERKMKAILDDTLASMVVLPIRMLYKMDLGNDFFATYQPPIGIASVTVVDGHGFVVEKRTLRKADVPDVYCNVQLGGRTFKTSVIKDNLKPVWNESADFLLSDHDQTINMQAWDEDNGTLDADDDLGTANVSVADILIAGKKMNVELQQDYRGTGAFVNLRCDVCELTADIKSFETRKGKNQYCGLMTILVTRAAKIPVGKKEAATFVKVTYGGSEFLTSAIVDDVGVDALNPIYDAFFHVPLTKEIVSKGGTVVLSLMNGETILGTTSVTHSVLVKTPNRRIQEMRPIGDKGATIEFRVSLQGVKEVSAGASPATTSASITAAPAGAPVTPNGVQVVTVRITAVKGWGFKAEKRRFKKDDIPE